MLFRRLTSQVPRSSRILRGFADETVARGVNIKKAGADPPLKALEEYPDWVKTLPEKVKSLYEFRRQVEADGEDSLEFLEAVRYVKLTNRASIQHRNSLKAKK